MNRQLVKLLTLIGIGFSVLIMSCGDENESDGCEDGIMTCTLNGESWTATTFENTLLKLSDQGVDGKRLDIRGTSSDGIQLILTINETRDGWDGDCMRLDTWDTFLDNNSVLGHIFLGSKLENGLLSVSFIDEDAGTLTITNCDEINKTISGTFEFVITNFISGDTDVNVVNGEFVNVCYSVQ